MRYIQQQRYDIVANNYKNWISRLSEKELILYHLGMINSNNYTQELADKIKRTDIESIRALATTVNRNQTK